MIPKTPTLRTILPCGLTTQESLLYSTSPQTLQESTNTLVNAATADCATILAAFAAASAATLDLIAASRMPWLLLLRRLASLKICLSNNTSHRYCI